MQGWIKIHRKIIDWEWYADPNTCRVFIHCLLMANHKDKKYRGKLVPRGSFLTGRELLAKQTSLSVQSVRTALEHLKSTQELTIQSTKEGTHIFVTRYADYQSGENESTNESTNNQPTSNQQVTTNKNDKNVKNEKKERMTPLDISHSTEDSVVNNSKQETTDGEKETFHSYQNVATESVEQTAERRVENRGTESRGQSASVPQDRMTPERFVNLYYKQVLGMDSAKSFNKRKKDFELKGVKELTDRFSGDEIYSMVDKAVKDGYSFKLDAFVGGGWSNYVEKKTKNNFGIDGEIFKTVDQGNGFIKIFYRWEEDGEQRVQSTYILKENQNYD